MHINFKSKRFFYTYLYKNKINLSILLSDLRLLLLYFSTFTKYIWLYKKFYSFILTNKTCIRLNLEWSTNQIVWFIQKKKKSIVLPDWCSNKCAPCQCFSLTATDIRLLSPNRIITPTQSRAVKAIFVFIGQTLLLENQRNDLY